MQTKNNNMYAWFVGFFKVHVGPGAVAQVVKVLALHAWDPIWFYPSSPASLPAPFLWPGKAVEDGPKLWVPAPAWETRKRLLASAVVLTWGVTHGTEDLPLCVSSLYISLSNKKIIKINLSKKSNPFIPWNSM